MDNQMSLSFDIYIKPTLSCFHRPCVCIILY